MIARGIIFQAIDKLMIDLQNLKKKNAKQYLNYKHVSDSIHKQRHAIEVKKAKYSTKSRTRNETPKEKEQ